VDRTRNSPVPSSDPPAIVFDPRASAALTLGLGQPVRRKLAAPSFGAFSKRAFDLVVSLSALLVLLPLFASVALLIRLDSRGPVFFRTKRVARGGGTLRMLKFRKMRDDAHGIGLTLHDDSRFTRIGAFLARAKLDELPQLWHVLRGEMSIVGPRPESHEFAARYPMKFARVASMKPGIFGLSQLAFSNEGEVLDRADPIEHYVSAILPQKIDLDLLYRRNWSVLLDARIVFWTVVVVLLRRPVSVNRTTGALTLRRRPGGDKSGRLAPSAAE